MKTEAPVLYLDSSVLLAILFQEDGHRPKISQSEIFTSELSEIEVLRSLERARLNSRLSETALAVKTREAQLLLSSINLIQPSRDVFHIAKQPYAVAVRALDCLHVASAEWLMKAMAVEVEFWTHDQQQGRAATYRGMRVSGLRE